MPIFSLSKKEANKQATERNDTNRTLRRIETDDQFIQGLTVEAVTKEMLTTDDIIIAVMGPTGSGKSTFIETAAGIEGWAHHGLHSSTSVIEAIRITTAGNSTRVVLVDTPGFDDTEKPDLEILQLISKWLKETYKDGLCLSGFLYVHRISDNRMAGTPLKNLQMFKKLCGEEVYGRVILMTTMWEQVAPELGIQREKELKWGYWAELVGKGSQTLRFEHNTPEFAWRILNHVIELDFEAQAIQIQKELVDEKKKLPKTKAGHELRSTLERMVNEQKLEQIRLRGEVLKVPPDPIKMQEIMDKLIQIRVKRNAAIADIRKLNPSFFNFSWYRK